MQDLGFDPDNLPTMTERMKFVAEEVKMLMRQLLIYMRSVCA